MVLKLPPEDLAHVQRHMRCWDQLRGKRVFITGATGFVGRWLVESLAWANEHLRLATELAVISRGSFPQANFDYGIHAARGGSFLDDVERTKCTLQFATENGVGRVLYTSSGAVYGEPSDYARAKAAGERLCEQSGLCAVNARLFSFVGPALPLDANFAVGNFIRDVLAGGPITVQGDGTAQRSYLYAADLAVWLWTLLLEGESAQPYDVGSAEAVSIADLARRVAANTKPETKIVTLGGAASGAGHYYIPSVGRARELELQPLVSLDEGIRRMYAWNLERKYREMAVMPATTP